MQTDEQGRSGCFKNSSHTTRSIVSAHSHLYAHMLNALFLPKQKLWNGAFKIMLIVKNLHISLYAPSLRRSHTARLSASIVLFLSQEMVVRGCCCCSSHVLFFPLVPCHHWFIGLVLCHLEMHQITLSIQSWIRRGGEKHRLRGDQRKPTFTSHQQTKRLTKKMGEEERRI